MLIGTFDPDVLIQFGIKVIVRSAGMENVRRIKTLELHSRRLFEAAQDGILILDASTRTIKDVNPFLINMLGYSRKELVNKKLSDVDVFKDIEVGKRVFDALQENEHLYYEDLQLKAKDGRLVQVEFVSIVYLVGSEKVIECNIRDITECQQAQDALRKSEALLREMSIRDHLTGLFNRRYMEETLERELLRVVRKHFSLGIIMLDVDDFKGFNDAYGHAAGDAVLHQLGIFIREHVRGEDIPCRYGGDEFIVVLPDASLEVTQERAKLLSDGAQHLQVQFELQTLKAITISIGIAMFPDQGATSTSILKAADTALYQSKFGRGGQVVVAG
jgi:diguanylate cyclase (GGDEF)-like protein/PAS domain S-box-containing protein